MNEPKTPEDWQHAAERWEAAHGEMMAAAGRWETAAGEWKQAHDTVAASNERLRYDLEREKIDIELVGKDLHRALGIVEDQRHELEGARVETQRAWDEAEHQRQRADHMVTLLTPEQVAELFRMMAKEQA